MSNEDHTCGDGIAAVVKELPQSRAAVGPPGLLPIDGVQRLVDEQAQRTQDEGPRRSLERASERREEGGERGRDRETEEGWKYRGNE